VATSAVDGAMVGQVAPGASASAVTALLGSPRLAMPAAARALVGQGQADPRLVSVLSTAVSHHTLVIGSMHSVSDPVHGVALEIVSVDGQPVGPSNIAARDLITEIAALDPNVRPSEIGTPWPIQSPGFFSDATYQNRLHLAFVSQADYRPPVGQAAAAEAASVGGSGPAPSSVATGSGAGAASAGGVRAASAVSAASAPGAGVTAAATPGGGGAPELAAQAAPSVPADPNFGSPRAHAAFEAAKGELGVAYRWGGTSPKNGFDCSGLMQWAYRKAGVDLPRIAEDQARVGTPVDMEHLHEGDLVFFQDRTGYIHHVGMYVGNHMFLHAPHTGDVVKESDLREPYWTEQFVGGRHIVPLAAAPATALTSDLVFVPHGGQYGFFPEADKNYTVGDEPEIAARLDALGKSLKLRLVGISGYRTPEHSVAVGGFANDPHTRGQASDTPGIEQVPEATLRRFGLTRPFSGAAEADHIQLARRGPSSGARALASAGASSATASGAPKPSSEATPIAPEPPRRPGTAVFAALQRQERSFHQHTVRFLVAVKPAPGSPLYSQAPAADQAGAAPAPESVATQPPAGPAAQPASQAPALAVAQSAQPALPGIAPEPAGGSIAVSSSLLTSGQEKFVARLAQLTGLNPRVVAAWALAEESGGAATSREAAGNFNWLNIGYFDNGAGHIAFDRAFGDPVSAAEQSAKFLQGTWGGASASIRAILNNVRAAPEHQIEGIAASNWASSHYGHGSNLRGTYELLKDMQVKKPDR
jgi:cell wall-associated NlpC family hydrolase